MFSKEKEKWNKEHEKNNYFGYGNKNPYHTLQSYFNKGDYSILIIHGFYNGKFKKNIFDNNMKLTTPVTINIDNCVFDIVNNGKNLKVLEIGCGYGMYGVNFARYVKEYIGIDINKKIVDEGNNHIKKFNIPNMKLLEITDKEISILNNYKFDIIISAAVFIHIDEELMINYMNKIKYWLNKDGYFSLHFNIDSVKYTDNPFVKYYTIEYIRELCSSNDLTILKEINWSKISSTKYAINIIGTLG